MEYWWFGQTAKTVCVHEMSLDMILDRCRTAHKAAQANHMPPNGNPPRSLGAELYPNLKPAYTCFDKPGGVCIEEGFPSLRLHLLLLVYDIYRELSR